MAIISWDNYKYYFDYDQQDTVSEVLDLYQTVKGFDYTTQFFVLTVDELSTYLNSFSSPASSHDLYVEFCQFVYGRASWVPSYSDERKWDEYPRVFPEEMQPSVMAMTRILKASMSWSTFISNGYTGLLSFMDSYPSSKKDLMYGFSKFMLKKAGELSDVWVNTEKKYRSSLPEINRDEKLIRFIQFSQFLQTQPYFIQNTTYDIRYEIITAMTSSKMAEFFALYLKYYEDPREMADFLVQDLIDKCNQVVLSNPVEGTEIDLVAQKYEAPLQSGIKSFLNRLYERGLLPNGFRDILNIPAFTGVDDTRSCSAGNTGVELMQNGNFYLASGGWYDSGSTPLTNLPVGFSPMDTDLYTWYILEVGKTFKVSINIIDITTNNEIIHNGSVIYTATRTGLQDFTFTSSEPRLLFKITQFADVSIKEIMSESCEPVEVYQVASSSQPQIDHLTPQGTIQVDDVYMVLLNGLQPLTYKTTVGTSADIISGLITVINAADGEWSKVTASNGTTYVIVTANNNDEPFTLEVISMKKELLSLSTLDPLFASFGEQYISYIQELKNTEFMSFTMRGRLQGVDGRVSGYTIEASQVGMAVPRPIGTYTTNDNGYFDVSYQIKKPYQQISYIQVLLKDGTNILTGTTFTVANGSSEIKTLYYSDNYPTPNYTTIADVVSTTGLSIPSALATFLSGLGITTLKDIRNQGGLKYITGLPVDQDDPAVVALDAHADLNTISYNIAANQLLIDNGILSLQDLGNMSRTDAVNLFISFSSAPIGGFNALNLHTISKVYGSFLQSMINGHRAASTVPSPVGKIPDLDAVLEDQCICNDCDAAVSPLAYLTDLLNYTTNNVKYIGSGTTLEFLESKFYQNFTEMPYSCDNSENLVCQQRVVVEILRRYISDPAHTPSPTQETALAKATKEYLVHAYRFLLEKFGTTYEEIRDIRIGENSSERKAALARQLNIPYIADGPDAFDPFTKLFVDIKSNNLTEKFLEEIFGLIDTTKNHLCTGVKLGDTDNQISRWIVKGFSWNINTDNQGYVYLTIDDTASEIRVYKNSDRSVGSLVATGSLVDTNRYLLAPDNESGLSGEFIITSMDDTSDIYLSLIPLTTSWRLQYLRNSWSLTDNVTTPYIEHTIPVIEPDIIGPDDFRVTDDMTNPFKLWKNRRDWVDYVVGVFIALDTTSVATLLDKMGYSITYTRIDSTIITHTPWSSVPSFEDFGALYQGILSGNGTAYDTAYNTIVNTLKLTIPSFLRLYDIYNASLTNDEKAIEITTEVTASTGIKQKSLVNFTEVKRGDKFSLSINGVNKITYTVEEGDTPVMVMEELITKINSEGGAWTSVTILNSPTPAYTLPLVIEADVADTPFVLTSEVFRSPSDSELQEIYSILTQVIKKVFFADWITEENDELIQLNSADYWNSITEPVPGLWPLLNPAVPLIDPSLIALTQLPEHNVGGAAISFWYDRSEELSEAYITIQQKREQESLEAAFVQSWGSGYLVGSGYNSLDEVLNDLNNLIDPETVAEAEAFIDNSLYITTDDFRRIMSVKAKNALNNPESVTAQEWNDVYQILTGAYKLRVLYSTWLTEEETYDYWKLRKASLPTWRADYTDRQLWLDSLKLMMRYPTLDPDIVRPDYLRSIDTDSPAYILWNTRYNDLSELFEDIKALREGEATALEGFDLIIKVYLVDTEYSAILIGLLESSQAGEDISGRLKQLNITQEALQFLLNIRTLAEDAPTTILDDEWNEVYSILLQADKERTFSLWKEQEQSEGILLTPDYFVISEYANQNYLTEDQVYIARRRMPEAVWQNWISTLKGRVEQNNAIYERMEQIVKDTEEEYMKELRDALVMATDVPGTFLSDKAKNISDKLLIDAENNCCQNITRVSQALETLQGLFFCIRQGLIQDTYPGLNIRIMSDRFDDEWTWMGSYANWRAAMFVNLYPENLLYPTYRSKQSYGFRAFAGILRDDNRLTPDSVCDATHDYFTYYEDVCNLTLVASCSGRTVSYKGYGCGASQLSMYKNLQYLFATGQKSGKVYYSTIDTDSTDEYAHSFWEPINAFNDIIVNRFVGATPWNPTEKKNVILLFAEILEEGETKLAYAQLNLDTGLWDDELTKIAIPSEEGFDADVKCIKLNKANAQYKISSIYIAVQRADKLRSYILSPKGDELSTNASLLTMAANLITAVDVLDLCDYIEENLIFTYKLTVVNIQNVPIYYKVQINRVTWSTTDRIIGYRQVSTTQETTALKIGRIETLNSTNGIIPNYNSGFIWPDSDSNLLNDTFYILYDVGLSDMQYRIYSNSNKGEIIPTSNGFVGGLENMYVFANSSGKTFILYQQGNNKAGIFLAPINRDLNTGSISIAKNSEQRLTPNSSGPFMVHPGNPTANYNYQIQVQTAFKGNQSLKRSATDYIQEAYYFVPMLAALSLQSKGYYTSALDWFRLVYDYSIPLIGPSSNLKPRKIWYGLTAEETIPNSFARIKNWLNDPINPHAIAETRPNAYTRYTVLSIVRCMLDFANDEFTKDTAESVPRARQLYEEALELLQEEKLVSEGSECQSVIDPLLQYDPEDPAWYDWKPVWQGILTDLYQISDKSILQNTVTLIQSELLSSDELAVKMSVCRDIVDDAMETPEFFTDLGSLLSINRITTRDAMLRMIRNSNLGFLSENVAYTLTDYYLKTVALVTGLPQETLQRTDFYLSWFSAEPAIVNEIPAPDTYNSLVENYPLRNGDRNRVYYNYVAPSYEQILTLTILKNPIKAVNDYFGNVSLYLPTPNLEFCVPPNPILGSFILEAEANLYKLRNCMNISGIVRELSPYAAPTDQFSGIQFAGANGQLNNLVNGGGTFRPSQYKYEYLIQRAKEQVQLAQQVEAALISMYEKADAENYSLLRAKQDLGLSKAGIRLQDLRLKEADSNIRLAELQKQRVQISYDYFSGLLNNPLSALENIALNNLLITVGIYTSASIAAIGELKASLVLGYSGQSISTLAQYFNQLASYERRAQEWKYQQSIANQDLKISDQQIRIANDQRNVVNQERQIALLQNNNAEATLEFLANKFTNAELYEWMSKVLSKVYSYFLQQATASALTAQSQLAFERQTDIPPYIKTDYWEAPADTVLSIGAGTTPDRRGLTGSARLLQDLVQLDQYAIDSDKRRLQITKNISLATLDPVAFQQFRETGKLTFQTPSELFDRDFPGHYLRLIKQVRVTVIALIPPIDGIKATLVNPGISYAVEGNTFKRVAIRRDPEMVALSSPQNATGVFELSYQTVKLNPFESIGADTFWDFSLPKAANFFDYSTIADVLFTIDYTSLDSSIYRSTVIQSLDKNFEAARPYSFRDQLSDQWYELSNSTGDSMSVSFDTLRTDFPVNLEQVTVKGITLYFAQNSSEEPMNIVGEGVTLSSSPSDNSKKSSGMEYVKKDNIISTSSGDATSWNAMLTQPVSGTWTLTLPKNILKAIREEKIADMLFVIYYEGRTPEWDI
jgi:hypothetical protein